MFVETLINLATIWVGLQVIALIIALAVAIPVFIFVGRQFKRDYDRAVGREKRRR